MKRETLQLAEDAAAVLESAVFAEAFAAMDRKIVAEWRTAHDKDKREELFYRQRALRDVRGELLEHINRAAAHDARDGVKNSPWRTLLGGLKGESHDGITRND